jgi:hypothetical protein
LRWISCGAGAGGRGRRGGAGGAEVGDGGDRGGHQNDLDGPAGGGDAGQSGDQRRAAQDAEGRLRHDAGDAAGGRDAADPSQDATLAGHATTKTIAGTYTSSDSGTFSLTRQA